MTTKLSHLLVFAAVSLAVLTPRALAETQLGNKKGPTSKIFLAETKGETQIENHGKIFPARQASAGPSAFPARPPMRQPMPPGRSGFGLPSLRRNVCPHFYMTGSRGAIPIQAPHLLKGLLRQPNNVSRCQLRGGVHLDEGYVNDVCLTPRFNQCVFYEDELTRE